MSKKGNRKWLLIAAVGGILLYSVGSFIAYAQYINSTLQAPPPYGIPKPAPSDSLNMQYDVQPTVPQSFEDITEPSERAIDLKTPQNIKTEAEYDPATGFYTIRTKLGDMEIASPFLLSADEYNDVALRKSMIEYYRQKNAEEFEKKGKKEFNFLDMNFALGPLEKVFGPGGVQLKTSGSVALNMGIKSNKTDNPSMPVNSRRRTYFDFDQKIQATIAA